MENMFRLEKDLLGEKEVPVTAYYGVYTVRALENFPLSGCKVNKELIKAIALIKKAAAGVNEELGYVEHTVSTAIMTAATEVMEGSWESEFVIDALQGGAGTSTNMNVNEVIANRAIELLGGKFGDYRMVHPLDHVNLHQSTNDVYPTALRIAAIWLLKQLSDACAYLQERLQEKESEFGGIIKVGRTQLQDAVPMMLGQEFGAWAQAVSRDRWRLYKVEERLRQTNLGGTAIGTGMNADRKYIYMMNDRVRQLAKAGLSRAENMVDLTQNADVFVEVSGLIKALAVNLGKIANDMRLLASGPRAGLGEIHLPERQAGSSLMPGKVNPVIPEAVNQCAYHVIAGDMAITLAAQAGQLELNAFLPLIAHHLLGNIQLLTNCVRMFADFCVKGIQADDSRCRELLEGSLTTVSALVPYVGYDQATVVARQAYSTKSTVQDTVRQLGIMTSEQCCDVFNPQRMTHPFMKIKKE